MMDQNGHISKMETPVIADVPVGYTDHFRDPKVWSAGEEYYAVIGAQRDNKTGCVVLYRSSDLKQWQFAGEMKIAISDFGYMWECP